jgi:protein-tyrosine phosphatase|tara:strand:- start:3112 stop:3534 length:423 start_codon:yes stop_codon:yes gene_type:complete
MVCLGNICRSPLAEGVLKSKLSSNHFRIDSAATASFHIGKSPDYRSIKIAADHGIDISLQKARVFKLEDFNLFDRIYVMDRNNLKIIKQLSETPEQRDKVSLILENEDLQDPYYGDESNFKIVFELLNEACEKIKFDLIN